MFMLKDLNDTSKLLKAKLLEESLVSQAKLAGHDYNLSLKRGFGKGKFFRPHIDQLQIYTEAYIGEGFSCYKEGKYLAKSYDINSTYPNVLLTENIPLSNELTKRVSTDRFLEEIKVKKFELKQEFQLLNVSLYDTELRQAMNATRIFNDQDMYNIKRLYNIDYNVVDTIFFKDVGPCPDRVKERIIERNNIKKTFKATHTADEYAIFKIATNSGSYGFFVRKFKKGDMGISPDHIGLVGEYAPIGMYQCSFTKTRIIDAIIKYYDYVIYSNTDNIIVRNNCKFEEEINNDKIGAWKLEWSDKYINAIRPGFYFVFNKDGSIDWDNSAISGLNVEISKKDIKRIIEHDDDVVLQNVVLNKLKDGIDIVKSHWNFDKIESII